MYIDKLIKREVITLLVSVSLLVIIFIGVTYAKFLSVDKGQDTVINMGDLNISFCKDTTCDSTYTNIGQVIGTKVENGTTVPAGIYPFPDNGTYSNETPYIFKVTNTGSLDSTVKIKLKEDASFTPTGDYSSYARLTSKYADHLKVAIKKKILYQDTGYQFGDVNMDGLVNLQDVNLVLQAATENATLTDVQKKLIGLDSSATISAVHAANILQILNGTSESSYSTKVYTYSDLEDGVIFKDDIIKSGESAIYFLWLYLDEKTPNDAQKTYFVGNIDVDGEYIPISFSNDSWETIIANVKAGNGSEYKVGSTKEVNLGTTYGTHTLRIANTSTPSECSTTGFSQSACGFVLEFADIITTHKMNDTGTNVGSWPASSIYTFVNNDIYNAIPDEIKNAIIDTTVVSGHGKSDTENFTSTDKLYLLAAKEIYSDFPGIYTNGDTAKDLTRTLDYYTSIGVTTDNYSGAKKKNGTSASYWWLRVADSGYTNYFYLVIFDGRYGNTSANSSNGVAPAFRLG